MWLGLHPSAWPLAQRHCEWTSDRIAGRKLGNPDALCKIRQLLVRETWAITNRRFHPTVSCHVVRCNTYRVPQHLCDDASVRTNTSAQIEKKKKKIVRKRKNRVHLMSREYLRRDRDQKVIQGLMDNVSSFRISNWTDSFESHRSPTLLFCHFHVSSASSSAPSPVKVLIRHEVPRYQSEKRYIKSINYSLQISVCDKNIRTQLILQGEAESRTTKKSGYGNM